MFFVLLERWKFVKLCIKDTLKIKILRLWEKNPLKKKDVLSM